LASLNVVSGRRRREEGLEILVLDVGINIVKILSLYLLGLCLQALSLDNLKLAVFDFLTFLRVVAEFTYLLDHRQLPLFIFRLIRDGNRDSDFRLGHRVPRFKLIKVDVYFLSSTLLFFQLLLDAPLSEVEDLLSNHAVDHETQVNAKE